MIHVTDKAVEMLKSLIKDKPLHKKASDEGKDTCVRLGAIVNGDNMQYKFLYAIYEHSSDDICVEFGKLKFVFAKSDASMIKGTTIDISEESDKTLLTFTKDESK